MTQVLEKSPIALEELPRPSRGDDLPEDFDGNYVFHIGNAIVGETMADCFICAWKEGYRQWPDCQMAAVLNYPEHEYLEPCLIRTPGGGGNGHWFFFERKLIVVRPPGANCCNCAWQAGRSQAPMARFAMDLNMKPRDAALECRKILKERWKQAHGG